MLEFSGASNVETDGNLLRKMIENDHMYKMVAVRGSCLRSFSLTAAGLVHVRGPVHNRCPGS